jgi:hypothetical protein
VSDWWYVAIAYTVVWGSLALYALFLARRVSQARGVARRLRETIGSAGRQSDDEDAVCDGQPAP